MKKPMRRCMDHDCNCEDDEIYKLQSQFQDFNMNIITSDNVIELLKEISDSTLCEKIINLATSNETGPTPYSLKEVDDFLLKRNAFPEKDSSFDDLKIEVEWARLHMVVPDLFFLIDFSIPWIDKWTPEIGFTEEDIPCLYRTYYNNFWDKLMKQDPKTKQLVGQELLDSISEQINEYNKIPKKGIVNDNSVRYISRRISFQEGDKEKMIQDYLEEVRKYLLQTITHIDKFDTSMRSETSIDTAGESQQAETDRMLSTTKLQDAEDFLQQMKTMDQRHGKET
ncbi:hypothetical protein H5410_040612 [Solanum commersonii]|uniref:Uncharacterized protein n=1 Tax=Solanum commersonii TaxID=4109 RepID=A0A9J5XQM6_SOLCO|nr:hypothetical protein H5410_040612 [Solanum commersonii]